MYNSFWGVEGGGVEEREREESEKNKKKYKNKWMNSIAYIK